MGRRKYEEISIMKGIILAGGNGTRLKPSTIVVGKQLLPVFDKPMIYYSLSTLIHAGVNEILVVTTPSEVHNFKKLLSDGSNLGISISYLVQNKPDGIPQGISLAKDFLDGENFWFILGDNLFHGPQFGNQLKNVRPLQGVQIFGYRVKDPSSYGIAYFADNSDEITRIVEKPSDGLSNWSIPGLYYFDTTALLKCNSLVPSIRGELEIVDLLNLYLKEGTLKIQKISRGNAWFDLGTPENLLAASVFVETIQARQGLLVGSPEEAAYNAGLMSLEELKVAVRNMGSCSYANAINSTINW